MLTHEQVLLPRAVDVGIEEVSDGSVILPELSQFKNNLQKDIVDDLQNVSLEPAGPLSLTVDVESDSTDPDAIKYLYALKSAEKIAEDAWWLKMDRSLQRHGMSLAVCQQAQQLQAAHSFQQERDGVSTGAAFSIYECGPKQQDSLTKQELETLRETLTTIDQLSSGTLIEKQPVIIMTEGLTLRRDADHREAEAFKGRELAGYQDGNITVINVSYLRRMAQENNADFSVLLANTLVHETVGHRLEAVVEGDTGRHFKRHFDYSDEIVSGELYGERHKEVIPKNGSDSRPVREYGYRNSHEDHGTSVDATVADAMNWSEEVNKVPWSRSTPDAHRSELARGFLMATAERRAGHQGEGISTPIRYEENPTSGEVKPIPRDTIVRTSFTPIQVKEQVERTVAQDIAHAINKEKITYAPWGTTVG